MIPALRRFRAQLKNASPRAVKFHPAELFLLVTLAVFGTAFSLATPLGAGWDEETHMVRVWDLAHLHLIPNEVPRNQLPYPAIFWNLSYRRQLIVRPVSVDFWSEFGAEPLDGQGYQYDGPKTRSYYSPPVFAPYALVLRYLGLKFGLSALTVFYACRLAGLATYAMLAWMAVRLIPFGKWILAVAALAPTALYQASTIGADPVSTGAALLFVAACLSASSLTTIGWRGLLGLAGAASLLFWGKPNVTLLAVLPLLLLPASRFRMRGGLPILTSLILALGAIEVGGWMVLGYSGTEGGASLQLAAIFSHPVGALSTIATDLWTRSPQYVRQWIGEYGYGYGVVPVAVYILFGVTLAAAWWTDSAGGPLPRRTRSALLITFGACVLGTSVAMYLAATPAGADYVEGIQGRYYTAIAPLLGLALIGVLRTKPLRQASGLTAGVAIASLAVFAAGLVLTYYVVCGASYYRPGLCYLPSYKNWSPNDRYSAPVSATTSLRQEIVSECSGMSEIRVWVDGTDLPADGQTVFVARDPAADRDLVRTVVSNSDLPGGGWLSLAFPPEWDSLDKLYLLRISTPEDAALDGARIAFTARQEYPEVKLIEGSEPVDADLVFKYGCVAGLGKHIPALRTPITGAD